jgi:NAD-dependent dihydropyrimidine dehydrogenase PreA subunit
MRYLAGVVSLSYDDQKCTGCRRCVEVCPHGVFTMDGTRALLANKDLCMECGACQKNCEFAAISVDSGVGCAAALIGSMVTGGEAGCGCADQAKPGCCG